MKTTIDYRLVVVDVLDGDGCPTGGIVGVEVWW